LGWAWAGLDLGLGLAPFLLFETERVEHSTQVKFFFGELGELGFWNVPQKRTLWNRVLFCASLGLGGQKTGFAYFKDLRRIEERISNLQQWKGKKGASWG
jgi:hypothetical protein